MNKKFLFLIFLLIGLSLLTYGLITSPIGNEAEIINHYDCGRITEDLRSTDKYCYDPSSAPEAKKDFGNSFVYSGLAVTLLGSLYLVIILTKK